MADLALVPKAGADSMHAAPGGEGLHHGRQQGDAAIQFHQRKEYDRQITGLREFRDERRQYRQGFEQAVPVVRDVNAAGPHEARRLVKQGMQRIPEMGFRGKGCLIAQIPHLSGLPHPLHECRPHRASIFRLRHVARACRPIKTAQKRGGRIKKRLVVKRHDPVGE